MGLFRRARPAAEPTGPASAPESTPPHAPSPGTPSPHAGGSDDAIDAGPRAWEALAPLTRTVPPPAPTFKTGSAVREDLVAPDSPRLTRGLGHLVSDDGPPGVVSGLALRVQRRAADDAGTAGAASDDGPAPADLALPLPHPSAEAATDTAPGLDPGAILVPRLVPTPEDAPDRRPVEGLPVEAPARHLPLVSSAATTRPTADPSVADPAAPPPAEGPEPRLRHGALGPPTESPHRGSTSVDGALPHLQRTALDGPAPTAGPEATPPAAAQGVEMPLQQRPASGRRPGPDGGDPAIVAPDRGDADAGGGHGAASAGTDDLRAAARESDRDPAERDVRPTLGVDDTLLPLDGATDATTATTTTLAGDASSTLPLPTIQRRALDDASAQTPPDRTTGPTGRSATGPPGGAPSPPSPAASGPTTLPLVAQRSLAPPALLAPATGPAPGRPSDADPGPAAVAADPTWPAPPGPVTHRPVVQRWPDLSSVGGAGRDAVDAAARGARDRARDALPPLDLASLPAAPSLPAPSLPGWPDQSGIPGMPSIPSIPSMPGMPSMPAMPSAADLPSMPAMPHLPSTPGLPSVPTMPGVPSAADLGVPAVAGAVPMTEITFPSPGAPGDATGAASPSTPGAAGGGAAADGDLDELAHKLYDRIRWRMRSELRLDRERAGLGAGVRR